jgi:hypothetical protein
MKTEELGPLTMDDVIALSALWDHIGQAVRWLDTDDRERCGVIRGLRAEEGSDGYVRQGQDVRTTYIRITDIDTGWELWRETMWFAKLLTSGQAALRD